MHVVVRIWAVHLGTEILVAFRWNLGVRKELTDRGSNRSGRVWRTSALLDYDALPFIEEVVRPHHIVNPVLAEGEHEIHDREWEQTFVSTNTLVTNSKHKYGRSPLARLLARQFGGEAE